MTDPVAMDTNDLGTVNQIGDDAVEDNMPHFTLDMDGSILVDGSFLINTEFPETSDEMDYTEEIGRQAPYEVHPSEVSEQEVPSDSAVQDRIPAEETVVSQTEVQPSEPFSTQSVPVSSHQNVSKEPTNKMSTQIHPRGAAGYTSMPVTTSANAVQSTINLQQLYMLQKMMGVHQAGILQQRMNVPNRGIPNLRMMHNITGASQLSLNLQQMNFLRLGVPRLRALPVGWTQNRMGVPQIHLQPQRSQCNLRFPRPNLLYLGMLHLNNVRGIPPIHVQSSGLNEQQQEQQRQQKLLQLELLQQQVQKQQQQLQIQLQQQQNQQQQQQHQLQSLTQQEQVLQAQLNILRNIRAQSLRTNPVGLGMRQQGVNALQMNISQNVSQGRVQLEHSTSSQQSVQRQLPRVTPSNIQQNVLNSRRRMNVNQLVPDISQLNVNTVHCAKNATQVVGNRLQLRVPQMSSNILQVRAPQLGNVPHVQMQQLVATAQQLARNVTQLNIPQAAANMPQVGTSQLPSNVPPLSAPRVVSNVPRLNAPQLTANMPQILRSVQQFCLQQQAAKTSQLHVPQLAGNVSPLCVPHSAASNLSRFNASQLTTNVPQLSLSQPSSSIPRLGVPLPSSAPNAGLRAGMTNTTQINMTQSVSSAAHLSLLSNMRPSGPQMGIPEFLMNMQRVQSLAAKVPHVRVPQTDGSLLNLGERYQKTAAPGYERLQRLEFEENQQTSRMPRTVKESQDTGPQQKETGVTQQLTDVLWQSLNSSQQSASAPQPVDGQKLIVSQSEKVSHKGLQEQEEAVLKGIQRRRVRQKLALLNLWKRYERYRVARATYGMKGKKNQGKLRHRRTLNQKHHRADCEKPQLIKSSKSQ